MLSPIEISRLVLYCPKTGVLKWNARSPSDFSHYNHGPEWAANNWNAAHAGNKAGGHRPDGYIQITIKQRNFRAHRIAWAVTHGAWPECQIDHINGVRDDNRLANLRAVDATQNARNAAAPKTNKSGRAGVYYNEATPSLKRRWQATIGDCGKRIHLGSFMTMAEAIASRDAAEKVLGYTARHGR